MDSQKSQQNSNSTQNQLLALIAPKVASLGYAVIHLELECQKQKTLRLYIDHLPNPSLSLESNQNGSLKCVAIGIEDCVKVAKGLNDDLDLNPEIQELLPTAYELEVSSPGADRPLRTPEEFAQFAGQDVRIHLFRPLTAEESENSSYQSKNPKQKNFLGTLLGLKDNKVLLSVNQKGSVSKDPTVKNKDKKKAVPTTNSAEELRVAIPLPLISKANLEPHFDFGESNERES